MGCSDLDYIHKKELKTYCTKLYKVYFKLLDDVVKLTQKKKIRATVALRIVESIDKSFKSNKICNCVVNDSNVKKLKSKIVKTKKLIKSFEKKKRR